MIIRRSILTFSCVVILLLHSGYAAPPEWSQEVQGAFAALPVLESGRIKPLDTVARFTLLRINGKRSLKVVCEEGTFRRSPMEWYLDCLFYPETAKEYRCFSVESSETIVALGVVPHGGRRARYSYRELAPGIDRLMELARELSQQTESDHTFIDRQLITLANNVLAFESLTVFMNFARISFDTKENIVLAGAFPDQEIVRISDIAAVIPGYLERLSDRVATLDKNARGAVAKDVQQLFDSLDSIVVTGQLLDLFPPNPQKKGEWLSPATAFEAAFDAHSEEKVFLNLLKQMEELVDTLPDESIFTRKSVAFHDSLSMLAKARNEYAKIPMEVTYYQWRFFFLSQWLFLLAFIIAALSWTLPQSGRISLLCNLSILPPLLLLAAGIVLRCIIRGRPPVTNAYETILFTTLVAALLGFLIELIHRRRIAMSLGATLGMLGMFFSMRYEAQGGMDTMPAVIAVLDTNFWLASHVTTIITGYGAGLFAAAVAHVYILGRIFGIRTSTPRLYMDFGRIIYGVVCFCLLFTLIGTVLGGIWAAQSWGRFWGWDPKENGALLIVLWTLAMMHAKRGGYLRHGGIAISTVMLGMIIVFAWWGVNALGVGLHSYGFVAGVWRSLAIFWLVESVVILTGFIALARPVKN